MSDDLTIKTTLKLLQNQVFDFIAFFQQPIDFDKMVYTYWSAKDVLGHVTFWHESFARNVSDLAAKRKPNPLKGKLSEVNQLSVESTKETPILELINRLSEAQKTIDTYIINESILEIPYKKGSRNYTRLEHLDVTERHFSKHLKDLNKAVQIK